MKILVFKGDKVIFKEDNVKYVIWHHGDLEICGFNTKGEIRETIINESQYNYYRLMD